MTYTEQLEQKEWYEKCNKILQRDKYTCHDCGCRGYHSNTFYETDKLEEVDLIINKKILIDDTFSNLINQTLNKFAEASKAGALNDGNIERSIPSYQVVEKFYEYKDIKPCKKINLDGMYIYEFFLNSQTRLFMRLSRVKVSIITKIEYNAFDFSIYRYDKSVRINDSELVSYPMAIMIFDKELTEKYYLNIDEDGISVTYKNYAFFVRLNNYQFKYKGLNIHHKYYISGKKPWEYEDDALVTLCEDCHKKRHEQSIPVYASFENFENNKKTDFIINVIGAMGLVIFQYTSIYKTVFALSVAEKGV